MISINRFQPWKFSTFLLFFAFLGPVCNVEGQEIEVQEWTDIDGNVHLGKALTYERGFAKIQVFQDGSPTEKTMTIAEDDFTEKNIEELEKFSVLKDLPKVDPETGACPVVPGQGVYRCAFLVGPRFSSKSYLDTFEKRAYRLMNQRKIISDEAILKDFLRPTGANEFEKRRNSIALLDDFTKSRAIEFSETVFMTFPMNTLQKYDFENNQFRVSIDFLTTKPKFCEFWLDGFHLDSQSKTVGGKLKLPPEEAEELVNFLAADKLNYGRLSVLIECNPFGLHIDERRVEQGRNDGGTLYFEPKKLTIYANRINSGETRKVVTMDASDFFVRGRNMFPAITADKIVPLK